MFILVKKSYSFGYFCARDNLNKLPSSPFLLFCFCYLFVSKSCLHQWKISLLSLRILNRKIKHFKNLLLIHKPIKFWPFWNAFLQHNPNQRSHESAYLTSLMTHVQSFEVLSTKCIWSSYFILISVQLAQPKLDSFTFFCHAQPLFGSHFCWSINHLCSMISKHFFKISMSPLEIRTKNAHLTSRYDIFVKDYIQL